MLVLLLVDAYLCVSVLIITPILSITIIIIIMALGGLTIVGIMGIILRAAVISSSIAVLLLWLSVCVSSVWYYRNMIILTVIILTMIERC